MFGNHARVHYLMKKTNYLWPIILIIPLLVFISGTLTGCNKKSYTVKTTTVPVAINPRTPAQTTTSKPTPTPVPPYTHTPTATAYSTATQLATATPTASSTPTATPTATRPATATPTKTATLIPTPTATPPIAWDKIEDTVQLKITTHVKKEASWGKLWTERVELTLKSVVKAGIPNLASAQVSMSSDKVMVVLPRATILDVKIVSDEFKNIKSHKIHSSIGKLKTNAMAEAKGKTVVSAIKDKKILGAAEIKVKQQLTKQLQSLGFRTIDISFAPQKAPIETHIGKQVIVIKEYGEQEIIVARAIVPINNCNGSAPSKVSKTFGERVSEQIFEGSIEYVEIEFPQYFSALEMGLDKFYGTAHKTENVENSLVELQAAPGTNIVYSVAWKKTRSYGLITLIDGDETIIEYYVNDRNLIGSVENAKNIGCK